MAEVVQFVFFQRVVLLCSNSHGCTDLLDGARASCSLAYRTLTVYKFAISQGHLPVGQTRLGDFPVVSRFIKVIFRMKPPTLRLSSTWSVKGFV